MDLGECVLCNNKITQAFLISITRFSDMLDMVAKSVVFSKIDLKCGFHRICIRLGVSGRYPSGLRMVAGVRVSHVVWTLTNAPSNFLRVLTQVLRSYIEQFVDYFDNL